MRINNYGQDHQRPELKARMPRVNNQWKGRQRRTAAGACKELPMLFVSSQSHCQQLGLGATAEPGTLVEASPQPSALGIVVEEYQLEQLAACLWQTLKLLRWRHHARKVQDFVHLMPLR